MRPKPRKNAPKAKTRDDRNKSIRDRAAQRSSGADLASHFELKTLPIPLQQAILNVFKHALDRPFALRRQSDPPESESQQQEKETKPLSELIQLVKSHLYHRDFDAAFADADGELLRAYALRWSAGRALAYAAIFGSVLEEMPPAATQHIISIGGGGGAELVALAAAWEDCEGGGADDSLASQLESVALEDADAMGTREETGEHGGSTSKRSLTIVDVADWSAVVEQLNTCSQSELVKKNPFTVDFRHTDILNYTEAQLCALVNQASKSASSSTLITLMFTLNELFTVSIPKTTKFLLHLTDAVKAGTLLLVVDSPGSYSTVSLGANKEGEEKPQRTYPMRYLLDHTLLNIAEGRWECLASESSKWFRRDEAKLRYWVGDGVGLEDMRFQLHLYKKLDG